MLTEGEKGEKVIVPVAFGPLGPLTSKVAVAVGHS
jgi:hypothetical protein